MMMALMVLVLAAVPGLISEVQCQGRSNGQQHILMNLTSPLRQYPGLDLNP